MDIRQIESLYQSGEYELKLNIDESASGSPLFYVHLIPIEEGRPKKLYITEKETVYKAVQHIVRRSKRGLTD
ncbi:hypothetical protein ACFO4L_12220 [Bacillus daqingensis]|uniref:Uncharacterized protein n=1 Tax=Bacillus daqingensis TaxID=872396 RepID=A0ABV9NVM1_9BACI